MGKKYIIEMEDEPFVANVTGNKIEALYRVKGFKSLVFDENGLSKLKPYSGEVEYQRGLDDAWNAARRIVEMWSWSKNGGNTDVFDDAFDMIPLLHRFTKFTPNEVIGRIKEYDRQRSAYKPEDFEVGDEVEYTGGYNKKGVVIVCDKSSVSGIYVDHGQITYFNWLKSNIKKTGRKFPALVAMIKEIEGK